MYCTQNLSHVVGFGFSYPDQKIIGVANSVSDPHCFCRLDPDPYPHFISGSGSSMLKSSFLSIRSSALKTWNSYRNFTLMSSVVFAGENSVRGIWTARQSQRKGWWWSISALINFKVFLLIFHIFPVFRYKAFSTSSTDSREYFIFVQRKFFTRYGSLQQSDSWDAVPIQCTS